MQVVMQGSGLLLLLTFDDNARLLVISRPVKVNLAGNYSQKPSKQLDILVLFRGICTQNAPW
jgi:hypothetical protein